MGIMSKQHKAGGEIDAWCTKCLLMLGHRIIAVDTKSVPARVECQTCDGAHNYRAHPPGQKPTATPARRGAKSASPSPRRADRASQEEARTKAAATSLRLWESSVSGHHPSAFRAYGVRESFREQELMSHTTFGDGVVVEVLDRHKIRVLFRDEARVLAHSIGS